MWHNLRVVLANIVIARCAYAVEVAREHVHGIDEFVIDARRTLAQEQAVERGQPIPCSDSAIVAP